MNILPKKNWHVRKKENIARVRRDEAEAAEKEREIERRTKLAEQEARLAFLRQRAHGKNGFSSEPQQNSPNKEPEKIEADIYTTNGNINFFKEAESGTTNTGTNKEYEEEKKIEKEDFEKKIGLLTYLGQDTYEASGKTAWFNENSHVVSKKDMILVDENEVNLKIKSKLDPMNEMKKHVNVSFYPSTEKVSALIPQLPSKCNEKTKSRSLCRKDKKHKREKHKKRKKRKISSDLHSECERTNKKKKSSKKKKKRRSSTEESSEDEEQKRKQLIKLREERLKRESRERKREERLKAGKDPDVEELDKMQSNLPYKQKYSSQFNPHLAKQNQERLANETTISASTLQAGVKYWLS